jgi:hypothetical protein
MTHDLRLNASEATEIGFLTMFTANLSIMIVPVIAALMSGDDIAAHIISIKIDNISAKLDILFEYASHHKDVDELAAVVIAEKVHILDAIAMRNKLAHGHYVFDRETGRPELFHGLLNRRRGKPKITPLSADDIKASCDRLEAAMLRILKAGGDRIKDPFSGNLILPPT